METRVELSRATYFELRERIRAATGDDPEYLTSKKEFILNPQNFPQCYFVQEASLQCSCCQRWLKTPEGFIPDFETCIECKDCPPNDCAISGQGRK